MKLSALLDPGTFQVVRTQWWIFAPALLSQFIVFASDGALRPLLDQEIQPVARAFAALVDLLIPGAVWTITLYLTTLYADAAWLQRPLPFEQLRAIVVKRRMSLLPVFALGVGFYSLLTALTAVAWPLAFIAWLITVTTICFAVPIYVLEGVDFLAAVRFSWTFTTTRRDFMIQSFALPAIVWFAVILGGLIFAELPIFGGPLGGIAGAFAFTFTVVHLVGVYSEIRPAQKIAGSTIAEFVE